MPVYCDVCTQPGSPNDDAGYTTNGGWLCPAHRQIEFTPEKKRALAALIDVTAECGGTTACNGEQDLKLCPTEPVTIACDESSACGADQVGHL